MMSIKNYAASMEKVICNLAQDVKNASTREELVDALKYLNEEIREMRNEVEDTSARSHITMEE